MQTFGADIRLDARRILDALFALDGDLLMPFTRSTRRRSASSRARPSTGTSNTDRARRMIAAPVLTRALTRALSTRRAVSAGR